jgi:hypothetical protein
MNWSADTRAPYGRLSIATLLLMSSLSIGLGLLIAHGAVVVAVLVIGAPLAAWLALAHPGITVGALWLVALNGIPLINLETGVGQLRPSDIATVALVAVAVVQWLLAPDRRRLPPAKVVLACLAFGLWWLFVFVRSLDAGIPATDALLYGRDFLSLTVLVPAAWIVLSTPKAWRECLVLVLGAAALYSVAYVGGALGATDATSFTHPQQVRTAGDLQRLYTPMNDLVVAIAIFGLATLATTRKTRATPLIAVLTGIMLLAFLLQLTRAAYLGMAIGCLIAIGVALTRGARVRRILARRATVLILAMVIAVFALSSLGAAGSPTGAVSHRITSGFAEVGGNSGNVGYRVNVYHKMLHILGTGWPVGLGFLNPKDRYFGDLPSGSIRNADVGLMNAVMTMGVVGLALLVGVLVAAARYVVQTRRHRPPWTIVGLFGWLAVVTAGALTLVTLFSPTGLFSTSLTLVMCSVDMPRLAGRVKDGPRPTLEASYGRNAGQRQAVAIGHGAG